MGHRFIIDPCKSSLRLNVSGFVTFEDRLEIFDKLLFFVRTNDIRDVVTDCSRMSADNLVADDIYLIDVISRYTHKLCRTRNTLIIGQVHQGLIDGIEKLDASGLPISTYLESRQLETAGRSDSRSARGDPAAVNRSSRRRQWVAPSFEIFLDRAAGVLIAEFFGMTTFTDRLASFEKIWLWVRRHDIKRIFVDLSKLHPKNKEVDELYFAEFLRRYGDRFLGREILVLHSSEYKGAKIPTATLRGIGVNITDITLDQIRMPPEWYDIVK